MTIEDRLLPDRITVKKPVSSFAAGTRRPVFEYQVIATGIKARFDPGRSTINKNVLGSVSKKTFQLFLNKTELEENYEVVNEENGKVYLVIEVKNIFSHHLEAIIEEKK